ncbi:PadR family transcriptional regulator [Plantibacter sp. Mn2098]|uniref:PadR family transcriptional regulator n=1 Tax=Plantibacter sp. Mn2098 TaxID=3395266 RepID=UPI003BC5C59C
MTTLSESAFWILTALAREPRHGYAILRDVQDISDSTATLRVTTLYAGLERLVQSGLIQVSGEEIVEGRARRYYELTPGGRAALIAETERLQARVTAARTRLAARTTSGREPAGGGITPALPRVAAW